MKRAYRILLAHAILLTLATVALARGPNDPIFEAMADELNRSMTELTIEGMPSPYFMSYRVQDNESATIKARYGSLVQTKRSDERYFYIEVRVGSPALDNSSFIGSWEDVYDMRKDLPDEDDYSSLRHEMWLYTDRAYKRALENLAGKRAYLQSHPSKEEIPDFAAAEPFIHMDEPVSLEADVAGRESDVRAVAQALRGFPALQDWNVTYTATAANKRYLNSEGSRHLKSAVIRVLEVTATAQAQDGQRLTAFARYITRDNEEPPIGGELIKGIEKMADDLEAMVAAPVLEEYAGPVLFSDFAAAQFISKLFVQQLSPPRKPLTAEEWMSQYLPDPKLPGRVNRRAFPEFVSITDEPGRQSFKGQTLVGHQVVDDEGVECRDIALVEDGRLVTLPMCRQPTKKVRESNGHARTLASQWTVPGVSNIVVETNQPAKDVVKELRHLCRDFGNEYGLMITLLEDPSVSRPYMWTRPGEEPPDMLTAPVIMYRVYEEDGRIEPTRGLVFDELTVRTLRDIAAIGRDAKATNLMQSAGAQGYRYPAAIVTAPILVEEMEFKASSVHEPLPFSERP